MQNVPKMEKVHLLRLRKNKWFFHIFIPELSEKLKFNGKCKNFKLEKILFVFNKKKGNKIQSKLS